MWSLWKEKKYPEGNDDLHSKMIHIVVSHYMKDLGLISDIIKGYDVVIIHVILEWGDTVYGVPDTSTVQVLSNVGRCDYTYA